jgi:hypothetical protein
MHRNHRFILYLALVNVLMLIHVACAGSAEQIILERFFTASRLRDLTQLHSLATVVFEPRESGTVLNLKVREVTSQPVRLASDPSDREVLALSLEGVETTGVSAGLAVEVVAAEATLRNPDGQVKTTTLMVTLERAVVAGPSTVRGRWVVTAIK